MKVHNLNKIPEGLSYRDDVCELSDYDIKFLEPLCLDEVWYWYVEGSYDGDGQILMRKGELYDLHDMGHYSCYGPLDDVEFTGYPPEELKGKCSKEYLKAVVPLFELAEAA